MAVSGSALRSAIDLDRSDMVAPVARADLAIGMQLLRASNMKALRLQLALFSRDHKMVVEAVDGLVDLDGEIASFIRDMPPADVAMREMDEICSWIDQQKRAIASEKLALGCLTDGPDVRRKGPMSVMPGDRAGGEEDGTALELDGYEVELSRRLRRSTFTGGRARPTG